MSKLGVLKKKASLEACHLRCSSMSPLSRSPVFFLPEPPLRQVFFPNRLLAGFPWLCADLYADTPLTRFLSAFGFLFSLFPF